MSEEKSVTESMNSIERRGSTSSNESEQDEEKQKTLQEQLNQLTASDSSDSDYIVSVHVDFRDLIKNLENSSFLTFFIQKIITILFVIQRKRKIYLQSIYGFEKNSVT